MHEYHFCPFADSKYSDYRPISRDKCARCNASDRAAIKAAREAQAKYFGPGWRGER